MVTEPAANVRSFEPAETVAEPPAEVTVQTSLSRVAWVPTLSLHETVASVSWGGLLLFTALKYM